MKLKTGIVLSFYIHLILCIHLLDRVAADASKPTDPEADNGTHKRTKQTQTEHKPFVPELPKEIIVIGGGIAGLAAARTLTQDRANFTVNIFEAQKARYGGRAWTDKITNMKARGAEVNLGAMFLNVRAANNPLLELVESFELQTANLDNPQFIIPWKGMSIDGDELAASKLEALQILQQALNKSQTSKLDLSVKDAVDNVLKTKEYLEKDSTGVEFVKCLPSYLSGDYSTHNYRPELLDSGYEKILLDGMGELADRLASGSPDELPLHIHLNKAVRQIKVDEEKKKVIVRTKDGLQTLADIVVVAVPASVIAAQDVLFEPAIPKDYQLACEELGNSATNRVIVEFEHAFWPSEFGMFIRAVQSEEDRGYLQAWFNIHRLIQKPVLIASLLGMPAARFEKLSDEEAQQSVLSVLTEMFGEEKVTMGGKIVRLQRSNWISDPLFRGGGTYPKVGTCPKLWDVLSEPLCPYVYFAGEHTNSESPGSLHGAYNSGVRVGNQILSRLCDVRMEEERIRKEMEERRRKKEQEEREKAGKNESDGNGTNEVKDEL